MRIFRISLVIFLLLILCAGTGFYFLKLKFDHYTQTPLKKDGPAIIFTVHRGEGLKSIAKRLEQRGIISHALYFRILGRLEKADTRIHAGEYEFSPANSPMELLQMMTSGKVRHYRLTIPEGLRITEIAKRVGSQGLVTEEDFLAAVRDPELARSLGIPVDSFEGYLFPDTYFFTKRDTAKSMIRTMVRRFDAVYDTEIQARSEELGLSKHEVVTLASIIEKETGVPHERALVSSVFHNRLAKGMRLETDPTVIYGIPDFNGNIRKRDLGTYTPYNTYMIQGLPPGPIASPGRDSIIACLWPDATDFIFFVSKNDGTHVFSTNLSDHNRAVNQYQRKHQSGAKK